MKYVLFEQKKIKWNKWHFEENKTEIMYRVLKLQQISFLSKYIKLISRSVFLSVFIYVGADR